MTEALFSAETAERAVDADRISSLHGISGKARTQPDGKDWHGYLLLQFHSMLYTKNPRTFMKSRAHLMLSINCQNLSDSPESKTILRQN